MNAHVLLDQGVYILVIDISSTASVNVGTSSDFDTRSLELYYDDSELHIQSCAE